VKKYKEKPLDKYRSKIFLGYLTAGFDDYLASRVLLNNLLLTQGAILASTAIEKYIKALMIIFGNESHGHLKKSHWNSLRNYSPKIYNQINKDFLKLCQKCYKLRYLDSLKDNFNLVIAQLEFLAELDHTIDTIEKSFKFISKNNPDGLHRYATAIKSKDIRLFQNNYILNNIKKSDLLNENYQMIYEIRIIGNTHFEIMYSITSFNQIRKGFLREGCTTSDNKTFNTAFKMPEVHKINT
jgi:hypothetical protein